MDIATPNPSQAISFLTILSGVDDALGTIQSILDSSDKAKDSFKESWQSVIDSYQDDIAVLDNELAMLPPSLSLYMEMKEKERIEERQQKKKKSITSSASSHALNFHLKRHVGDDTNTSDIFLLPPESETNLSDDEMTSYSITNGKLKNATSNSSKKLSRDQKRQIEEQKKFNLREKLLSKMEEFRKVEIQAMNQTTSAESGEDDDDKIGKESDAGSFERFQQKNSELMAKMIAQYKPRVVKCNRKAKQSKDLTRIINESNKMLHGRTKHITTNRDERIIQDTNNYCSIENLPSSTTIGGSSSLSTLVLKATNNVVYDNEDDTLNDTSARYSDFDFESDDEEDEGEYSSETFEA